MIRAAVLLAASALALAACERNRDRPAGEERGAGEGEAATTAAFSGAPDQIEGIWADDCERPFVRFEDRAIHVYPDGQTYDLTQARVTGDQLTVAYQSGNGAIEETYTVGDGTLQLVSGVYDGEAVPWPDKPVLRRCE